jgi:hypothetical protein
VNTEADEIEQLRARAEERRKRQEEEARRQEQEKARIENEKRQREVILRAMKRDIECFLAGLQRLEYEKRFQVVRTKLTCL